VRVTVCVLALLALLGVRVVSAESAGLRFTEESRQSGTNRNPSRFPRARLPLP